MNSSEVIPLLFKMVFTFLAAFTAISLWSKARDAAWSCMVLGALFAFIDTIYAVLVVIGLVNYTLPVLPSFPLLKTVLGVLPSLFFAIGFLVFLIRRRRY